MVDDIDIENLSMDLSAATIDPEAGQELDDSGIEKVPMADPGFEVSPQFASHGNWIPNLILFSTH